MDQPIQTEEFCLLHRLNPARNEARFYLITTGPALFDPYAVTRFWGQIGGQQRHMVTPCESLAEAQQLARRLMQRKLRRGYHRVPLAGQVLCDPE